MTARNAPCPCGSGKKFKHCHGAASSKPMELPAQTQAALQQLVAALKQGQLSSAEQCLQQWPTDSQPAELNYFSAILEQLKGNIDQALAHYAQAVQLQRTAAGSPPLNRVTMAVAAAIQLCETAAGNYPGSPARREDGMFGSGVELKHLEKSLLLWEQDASSLTSSEEIKQVHANAWYNLGCAALASFTDDDQRIKLFQKATVLDPGHLLAQFNLAFAHNYSFTLSPEQISEAHQRAAVWLESTLPTGTEPDFKADASPRRLRVAYLSSDFRQHSVAHFILPVLQQHDREQFEIFLYHNHPREDDQTRLARQGAEHFRSVARLSDDQLRELIRADQIDVLIDLNGLTDGHRLGVLAQRVAPLQLNWMGYPNTTGLSQMDFRIVDVLTDPPGQSEAYCTEKLLRLRHPFLCYAAPAELPAVTAPPCLKQGFITFGSFNALPKLNPPLLHCWAEILQAVSNSHLLIKNLGMDYPKPRSQIREIFAAHGIAGHRLIWAGKTHSQIEHLHNYAQVDISLDSYPYNGTTTSCDSLLMGVPVLSIAGTEHRSRVGLSLLTALGLETLVANDQNSLIRLAVSLASETEQLQSLRSQLRAELLSSRLTDAAGLTRNLESVLNHIWQNKLERGAS